VVEASGETDRLPLVALDPLQPPEAVQDVARVLDQVSVDLPPTVIESGLAVIVTVGAVTCASAAAVSPRRKIALAAQVADLRPLFMMSPPIRSR
jgi:hypothetical protein